VHENFLRDQQGVALMMVLWVMVLLAILATEFSSSMRVEVDSARNFKEEVECAYLAESGVELALAEIMEEANFHSLNDKGQLIFGRLKKKAGDSEETRTDAVDPVPSRLRIPLGAGTVSYRVLDENRKININTASQKMLLRIFEQEGISDEKLRATLTDSILDWRDENDLHRLSGAENDYYEHLDEPYPCKNAPLDTLEELLWIKGMTPEILYGTDYAREHHLQAEGDLLGLEEKKLPGIYSLLTVQKTGIVNPNTASPEVLNIFFPPDRVDNILAKRKEDGRFDMTRSNYFTIYSLGEIRQSGIRRLIAVRVRSSFRDGKPRILIVSWNDNEDPEKLYDLFDESPQH